MEITSQMMKQHLGSRSSLITEDLLCTSKHAPKRQTVRMKRAFFYQVNETWHKKPVCETEQM
jgi:hypothetical protein